MIIAISCEVVLDCGGVWLIMRSREKEKAKRKKEKWKFENVTVWEKMKKELRKGNEELHTWEIKNFHYNTSLFASMKW